MDKNTALILTTTVSPTRWEDEDKSSYELEVLEHEYRERLYSQKGRDLLKRETERAEARTAQ